MKLRNVLLKTVPYLLSVAGGVVLYLVGADNIHDANLNDLINNIAASLLAIPLVFLLYDYSNYRISRQVNKTLADGLNFKINSQMLEMLILMRSILGHRGKFTWGAAEKMLEMTSHSIGRHLKITPTQLNTLRSYRDKIDEFAYRTDKNNVLNHEQLQTLALLAREMTHLVNERQFRAVPAAMAKYAAGILSLMADWFDSQDVNTMLQQQNFKLALGMGAPSAE